jgi:hypothetical protein
MKTKAKPLDKKAMKKTKGGTMDVFVPLEPIKGESTDKTYKDEIDVLSVRAKV